MCEGTQKSDADVKPVTVFLCDLRTVEPQPQFFSPQEIERAQRYSGSRRHVFMRSRTVLRKILAEILGIAPNALRIGTDPEGKPKVKTERQLHISHSHAGDYSAIAVSIRMPVGVDIEQVRPDIDQDAIASALFSSHERAALEAGSDFFELWTRKEAATKLMPEVARHYWTARPFPDYVLSLASPAPANVDVLSLPKGSEIDAR